MRKPFVSRFLALTAAAALTAWTGACICTSSGSGDQTAEKAGLPMQKKFFLPEHIYAVPGVECNIYFRDLLLTINQNNYTFDVICKFGRNDVRRWRFTPEKSDGGKSFPLQIRVYSQKGLAAEGQTTVHVAPADAGNGRTISILMVGDSLTNATVYPARLHQLCQGENNPKLDMIGTHSGSGRKVQPGGVAHEGYGGWTWNSFLTRYLTDEQIKELKEKNPRIGYRTRSKFLTLKDGKPVFDLKSYMDRNNLGNMPDIITFQLGVNDVFSANENDLEKRIRDILANADALIAAFRKEAPDALIGVGFVTPGSNQDSFGKGYKCGQTAWGYFRNHFRLNQAMAEHFAKSKDPKLVMIPAYLNLDSENNFPVVQEPANSHNPTLVSRQNPGVRPASAGYRQIGDAYYAWLKYQLASPFFNPQPNK